MTSRASAAPPGLPPNLRAIEEIHRSSERSLWRLQNLRDSSTEVLKIVRPEGCELSRREVVQEFLLLHQIRHPHWVSVFGFHHLPDGSIGYRMEDLPGVAPTGPDSPGWAPRDLDAVRAILGALSCLHAMGHVHLDLKPEQILSGSESVCLIDPGLAAPLGTEVPARGTWGFIAPEVLAEKPWDVRADLYSLGCVLLQVWTGENPLGEGEIADQIKRQSERPRLRLRERIEDMPEGLDRVVETLLDPDPAGRPATAAQAWEALHTMAGYRDQYLERRRLPVPHHFPFVSPAGIEEEWDQALSGNGPDRWVIDGPIGSGRLSMLRRLIARGEAFGGSVKANRRELRVEVPETGGSAGREVICRIGEPEANEKVIELGSVGEACATAALAAYGLEPEGGEAGWTRKLLHLRLSERVGREEDKRACSRQRRAVAAALQGTLAGSDRERLAEALVAVTDEERPATSKDDPLIRDGWLRLDEAGQPVPATPPWDDAALRALVGDREITRAHERLLGRGLADPVARARHAIGAGENEEALRSVPDAVEDLRNQGLIGSAMDLLTEARELLGGACPGDWLTLHARLALQDGDPARYMPFLTLNDPPLPDDWRDLLSGDLMRKSDRAQEALVLLKRLRDEATEPAIQQLVRATITSTLIGIGARDEAFREGLSVLDEFKQAERQDERVYLAMDLLVALSERGETGPDVERAKLICEQAMAGTNAVLSCQSARILGGCAFLRGDFSQAKMYLEASRTAAVRTGDAVQVARSDMSLAGVVFEEGRLAESEAMNRRAITLFDQVADRYFAARARANVATVLHAAGRWGEALQLARSARQGLQVTGALDDEDAAVLTEMATLVEVGLLRAATGMASDMRDRLAARPQPVLESIFLRDLGRSKRWAGHMEDARDLWSESSTVARKAQIVDEDAKTLLEHARAELATGDSGKAAEFLEQANELLGDSLSAEHAVNRNFALAMLKIHRRGDGYDPEAASGLLKEAATCASDAELRGWAWRCHAAAAGVAERLDVRSDLVQSIRLAEEGLQELLEAIDNEVLQDSYLELPDTRLFLGWRRQDMESRSLVPAGSSDLEIFFYGRRQ